MKDVDQILAQWRGEEGKLWSCLCAKYTGIPDIPDSNVTGVAKQQNNETHRGSEDSVAEILDGSFDFDHGSPERQTW